MELGEKIKELRNKQGLTQEELADRAELSKGFISQLERDMTSPSIATLEDLLQCLGTTLGEFFNEEQEEEQIVFTEEDFFVKKDEEYKNQIKWIIPNAQKNCMEPIHLLLEKGGETCPDNPHEGEEFSSMVSIWIRPSTPLSSPTNIPNRVMPVREMLFIIGQIRRII